LIQTILPGATKKEVQKQQGVFSKAKRLLTEAEFWKMQKILQNHNKNNVIWRFNL
jgi:hypothetical protein